MNNISFYRALVPVVLLLLSPLPTANAQPEGSTVFAAKPVEPGTVIEVKQQWTGPDSKIGTREYHRITSEEDWKNLWRRHGGTEDERPRIDFRKDMVIAVMFGRFVNTSGIRVLDVRRIDQTIRFRFQPAGYQTGEQGDSVTPFGFFVIPKSHQPVVLEINAQRMISGPDDFQNVASFDGLNENNINR